jgi:hypothetical protein
VRVQRGQHQLAGGGQVEGAAGADLGDPQRKAGVVADDLEVAAEGAVLAGEPQVMRPVTVDLDAGGDAVGGDQRAVQTQEHHPAAASVGEDLGQVGGVGGDDLEAFVQVAVGGGDADPGLQRQDAQVQSVAQAAQHQGDLGVHRGRPLADTGAGAAAVPADPAGHGLQYRCGHIQPGTIGHSGLPGKRRSDFGETIFSSRARALFIHPAPHQRGRLSRPHLR